MLTNLIQVFHIEITAKSNQSNTVIQNIKGNPPLKILSTYCEGVGFASGISSVVINGIRQTENGIEITFNNTATSAGVVYFVFVLCSTEKITLDDINYIN